MRGQPGHQGRVEAARKAGARYAERYRSAEPGTDSRSLARELHISESTMLEILRAHGVDFEAVKEARRISTAKPRGGKQSPNTKPVRREPDIDAMIAEANRAD